MIKIPHTEHIFQIDNFLSPNECLAFIKQSEIEGYVNADVQFKQTRRLVTNIRNNERVNYFSEELAIHLWAKLSGINFPCILNQHAIALSPHFRFYKYKSGQKFNMHKDGRQVMGNNRTLCTLLIYLNDNYVGGNTEFRTDQIVVSPKTGSALCFEHHEWHKGCVITEGIKYVLRTDVIYAS